MATTTRKVPTGEPLPRSTQFQTSLRRKLAPATPRAPVTRKRVSPLNPSAEARPSPLVKRTSKDAGLEVSPGDPTPRSKRLRRISSNVFSGREDSVASGSTEVTASAADDTLLALDQEEADEIEILMEDEGFTQEEADLFERIRRRGSEPLMPLHWQPDFPTMPDELFERNSETPGHIESINTAGTFLATVNFQKLLELGGKVRQKREKYVLKKGEEAGAERTEKQILEVEAAVQSAIREYVQWAVDDVRQHCVMIGKVEIQPRIAIAAGRGDVARVETRIREKFKDLAKEIRFEDAHNEKYDVPLKETSSTLYGFVVVGYVASIVTWDARDPERDLKTLQHIDFSDKSVDFWNAVSVALVVLRARDDDVARHMKYKEYNVPKKEKMYEPNRTWQLKARRKGASKLALDPDA